MTAGLAQTYFGSARSPAGQVANGQYAGDRRGAAVVEGDGSRRRATEAELEGYDLELSLPGTEAATHHGLQVLGVSAR